MNTESKRIEMDENQGKNFSWALSLCTRFEAYQPAWEDRSVLVAEMVMHSHKPYLVTGFKIDIEEGKDLSEYERTHCVEYVIGDYSYYVPNTHFHHLVAAREIGTIGHLPIRVTSRAEIKPDKLHLSMIGETPALWISTEDPGVSRQVECSYRLYDAIPYLLAIGVRDMRESGEDSSNPSPLSQGDSESFLVGPIDEFPQ